MYRIKETNGLNFKICLFTVNKIGYDEFKSFGL